MRTFLFPAYHQCLAGHGAVSNLQTSVALLKQSYRRNHTKRQLYVVFTVEMLMILNILTSLMQSYDCQLMNRKGGWISFSIMDYITIFYIICVVLSYFSGHFFSEIFYIIFLIQKGIY